MLYIIYFHIFIEDELMVDDIKHFQRFVISDCTTNFAIKTSCHIQNRTCKIREKKTFSDSLRMKTSDVARTKMTSKVLHKLNTILFLLPKLHMTVNTCRYKKFSSTQMDFR